MRLSVKMAICHTHVSKQKFHHHRDIDFSKAIMQMYLR